MNDEKDPLLQSLFQEAETSLDGSHFVAGVTKATRRQQTAYQALLGVLGLAVLAIAFVLSAPLQGMAEAVTAVLTSPLIQLEPGMLDLMFSPINNLASILILTAKLAHTIWKRIRQSSYAYW